VSGDGRYGGEEEMQKEEQFKLPETGNRKEGGGRGKDGDEVTESCKIFKICTLVCALHTYLLISDSQYKSKEICSSHGTSKNKKIYKK